MAEDDDERERLRLPEADRRMLLSMMRAV